MNVESACSPPVCACAKRFRIKTFRAEIAGIFDETDDEKRLKDFLSTSIRVKFLAFHRSPYMLKFLCSRLARFCHDLWQSVALKWRVKVLS